MSDTSMPGGLPPEAFSPEVLAQTKRPFAGKQIILIAAAVIIIVLLVLIAWGFTYLLRDSAVPAEVAPTPTPSFLVAPVLPPERQRQPGLHVQVERALGTDFAVTLLDIHRTNEVPTIHSQEPPVTDPHSLIQLLAIDGTVINEFRFSLPTQVALEAAEVPGFLFAVPPAPFDLIIPVPEGKHPAFVRIITPTGKVITEQPINYLQLPTDSEATPTEPHAWLRLFGRVRDVLAQAQPQREIVIAVVNHQGADVMNLHAAVSQMVDSISPWSLWSPIIRVESVQLNNQDLGCQLFPVGPVTYPLCGNSGAVINAVQQQVADWDLIAVAVDTNCHCGSSLANSKIIAVGNFVSDQLVAHEFGHAVPTFLADEYFGDLGQTGPGGPNCFASKLTCQAALGSVGVGADQCMLGCNNPGTWRSESQIMYNVFTGFGPFDHKLMCEHIADLVGLDCADAVALVEGGVGLGDPTPSSDPSGGFTPYPSIPPPGLVTTLDPQNPNPVITPFAGGSTPTPSSPTDPISGPIDPPSRPGTASPTPAPTSNFTLLPNAFAPTPTPNSGKNSGNNSGFFGGAR